MDASRAAPVLSVEGFEGPLDWLLELARARQIDLAGLSIMALIEAFEAALLQAFAAPDLSAGALTRWGDWLVMAADLTVLRSRLLLAADPAVALAAQQDAEALRRRWLARAELAAAAAWLDRRCQLGRDVFPRGEAGPPARARGRAAGDITLLLRACLTVLALPPEEEGTYAGAGPPLWTVAEAAAHLRRALTGAETSLAALLPPVAGGERRPLRCRAVVASALVATLELARTGEVALTQAEAFGPVMLIARPQASRPCHPRQAQAALPSRGRRGA